jgi:hypothetical protein
MDHKEKENLELGATPPLFKSWASWYGLVIGALILQIILYFLFTLYYK